MTPERYRRIEEVFHAASALSPDARKEFLATLSAGDEALRAQVEAMLAADERSSSFLEQPPADVAAGVLAARQSHSLIGETLGDYRVIAPLGAGGMGEVFVAEDLRLGRKAALKLLPDEHTSDPIRLRRFEHEACAVSALNHPNIVTVYGLGRFGQSSFLATELVDGCTLRQKIRNGPLPLQTAIEIAIQTARALAAAHGAGIVHRDIKPENIIVRPDGLTKVLDFGLAKWMERQPALAVHANASPFETMPGLVVGTPRYMSPEQVRGEPVDARSDLFSLGAVLYELVSGHQAHIGETPSDILASLLARDPPNLQLLCPECPRSLVRIVTRSLQKASHQRYQTADELISDLKAVQRDLEAINGTANKPRQAFAAVLIVILCGVLLLTTQSWWRHSTVPRNIDSIAVLPLSDLSGGEEDRYFAEGMTEELITELARHSSLRVISRTSVMWLKGTKASVSEIAEKLNVKALIEGTARRYGRRVRITVQLIGVSPERHIWAEAYESDLGDVIKLQRSLAADITNQVQAHLRGKADDLLKSPQSVDVEAYELYLKGRYFLAKRDAASMRKAAELFLRSAQLDSKSTNTFSSLAEAYDLLGSYEVLPASESFPKAKKFANKALLLDSDNAEAYMARAVERSYYEYDWDGANSDFERALRASPNSSNTHHWYAEHLVALGKVHDSIIEMRRATELDPLSLPFLATLGRMYSDGGRFEEAIAECNKTLELDPRFSMGHWCLGQVMIGKRQYGQAIQALKRAQEFGATPLIDTDLGWAYAASGDGVRARAIIAALEQGGPANRFPYFRGIIYGALGERDKAFRLLRQAVRERDGQASYAVIDAKLAPLRSDPRYKAIVRELHLPLPPK